MNSARFNIAQQCLGFMVWLLLAMLPFSGLADAYRTLEPGMSGQDVQELKLRMYDLGYFYSDQVSDVYNELMAERISLLQSGNGLKETGIATAELQTFIFSGACRSAAYAQPAVTITPAPDGMQSQDGNAQSPYRILEEGDVGGDVLALKQRMYWLGYFTSYDNLSETYNRVTAERVMWFQRLNGLEETGIATPELQALTYSDGAVCTDNTPKPSPTPAPTPVPLPISGPRTAPELPALTANGFLTPGAGGEPFFFIDAEDGHWIYLSADLSVEIKRYTDPNLTLVWYETEIKVQNDTKLFSCLTAKTSRAYRFTTPEALAKTNHVVLAITDDFFGHRVYNGRIAGIIVRNGGILSDKTYKSRDAWPPLDTLAVFVDGSMKTFQKDEYTAQEYLDMGAEQVFAFGPILVQNGQIGERILDSSYYYYREPRCALGMIAPGHYLALTVNGRTDESHGAYLPWLAEQMISRGVTEALNLDGGGTTSLIFMGEQVNVGGTGQTSIRNVTSIIGFGTYAGDGE